MKTKIYYFTGAGNSLAVARQLSDKLDNAETVSIVHALAQKQVSFDGIMGIVCPIYMYNVPLIVADFIKKLKNIPYLFLVLAGGGEPGNAIKSVKILCATQDLKLNAAFNLTMPSNYAPYGSTPQDKQQEMFSKAEKKIEFIADVVTASEKYFDENNTSFFRSNICPGILYKLGYKFIPKMDKSFYIDENCNGCGICEKVCSFNNISILDRKPQWNHQCQQCFACLQWCPQEAIQYGKKTIDITRYHHPNVTLNAIMQSSSRK